MARWGCMVDSFNRNYGQQASIGSDGEVSPTIAVAPNAGIKYLTVPIVDLINVDSFFRIRLASFLEEMSAEEYQNFCLQVVAGCDTITTTDNKLIVLWLQQI